MPSLAIPGPRPLPVVGHLPWMMADTLGFLSRLGHRYGDLAAFRLGAQPAVLVNHPELIDRVVRDRAFPRSTYTRRVLGSFLGRGLLSLEGAQHMRHRRLMQPAFHRERIRSYGEVMAEETHALLDSWRSDETRDLRADMMRLTFAIVSRAMFSTDTSAEANAVNAALRRIVPWVPNLFRAAMLLPERVPLLHTPATHTAIWRLRKVVRKLVKQRRAEGRDRGDLLSMLLAAHDDDGSSLSDEELTGEVLTILVAGHETTANTLAWAWHLLTRRPDIQEQVAAEAREVAGEHRLGAEALPRLALADRVIRETLRLFPSAWWADRVPQEEVELGGYTIQPDTLVAFSVFVTHRDPRFFPDPERFDPDRFRPEREASIPHGAYLPFGAGIHMCIGNMFALMEARLILAAIAQRFSIETVPGQRVSPVPLLTLSMAKPFRVRVRARS